LPYLAFVEALRSYVLSRDIKDLREELGTGAADVARIVSEIRERLKVKLRPQKDPEEERYRLLQAVTSFLTNAACVQPLLVVLEDLHDADKGTLDMLTHVSRHLSGARLLIVGTYRDVEVDRSHPLSAALAELRLVSSYGRVILRGLNADEVRRMLESITRESVPWGLAEAVHRQTEGNPLFVQEVVRYLAEEGLITQKEGRWRPTKDTPLEMNIPEGLRDVIGKRLSLLSKECNQLLSVASVIGREFAIDTLRAVVGMNEDVFVNNLKEAVQLSILEERSQVGVIRYRFTHAFFRQTLYEEMIAPQRLKLHQQVARALETQYAKRLEEHAAELAEHFSQSTDPTDLAKAIEYGEMAAKRAMDVYAYGEAARLLEQALKVQRVLDPDDKSKMCDLLLALCEALFAVPDAKRIHDSEGPAAFSLAESLGDKSRAVRSCYWVLLGILSEQGFLSVGTPQFAEWAGRADRYASAGTAERAKVDMWLGMMKFVSNDFQSGKTLVTQAGDLARRVGDRDLLFQANSFLVHFCSAPQHAEERIRLAEELWKSPRLGVSAMYLGSALMYIGGVSLNSGQRKRAEEAWTELRNLAERTGYITQVLQSMGMDAILAVMDGRLDDATDIVKRLLSLGKETGVVGIAHVYSSHPNVRSRLHLGASLEELERDTPRVIPLYVPELCLVQSHLGRKKEVFEILEKNVVMRPGVGTANDETSYWEDTLYLEASVLAGHHKAAELLLNRLSGTGLYTTGYSFPTCIVRHLGGAAALLERYEEARRYYQKGLKLAADIKHRPELALTRLQLAELLLEHYPKEKKEALEHLDFAIKEFREMKMQPSLERVLRHKDILKA